MVRRHLVPSNRSFVSWTERSSNKTFAAKKEKATVLEREREREQRSACAHLSLRREVAQPRRLAFETGRTVSTNMTAILVCYNFSKKKRFKVKLLLSNSLAAPKATTWKKPQADVRKILIPIAPIHGLELEFFFFARNSGCTALDF